MNKKNLYLIISIIAGLVFIGYLTESGPVQFFGYEVNIWIMRLAWLLLTASYFFRYRKLSKT